METERTFQCRWRAHSFVILSEDLVRTFRHLAGEFSRLIGPEKRTISFSSRYRLSGHLSGFDALTEPYLYFKVLNRFGESCHSMYLLLLIVEVSRRTLNELSVHRAIDRSVGWLVFRSVGRSIDRQPDKSAPRQPSTGRPNSPNRQEET